MPSNVPLRILPSGGGVSRPGRQCGAAWSSAVPGSSWWSPRPAPARTRPRALTGRCARSRRRRSARIARLPRWYRCLRCDSWVALRLPERPRVLHPPSREETSLPLRGRPLRDRYVLRLTAIDRVIYFLVRSALPRIFLFASNRATLNPTSTILDLQGGLGGPSTTAITASFTTCTICSRSALPTCTWPELAGQAGRRAAGADRFVGHPDHFPLIELGSGRAAAARPSGPSTRKTPAGRRSSAPRPAARPAGAKAPFSADGATESRTKTNQ